MSNWTSLWYVWLILLTLFLLLLCGITASCISFCCRRKRLPVETFSRHPCDLPALAIDSDSTAHSTVTSYSSWQYPLSAPLPSLFVHMDKNIVSPPPYSLYAMELPPSYDEAVQMGKQYTEGAQISQKLHDVPGEVTPDGLNPTSVHLTQSTEILRHRQVQKIQKMQHRNSRSADSFRTGSEGRKDCKSEGRHEEFTFTSRL